MSVTVERGVADVRLSRPDKLNAFDHAMFDGLAAAGAAVATDPTVRAVVLSGEGRAFSAGLDLAVFTSADGDDGARAAVVDLTRRHGAGPANRAQQAVWAWRELSVPVIAAVHGACLGAGLQLALAADVRIVAPDARLSVLEVRWGLIPDMAGTYLLPRLVRPDVAKELTWSGRMVGGTEAVTIGLATRTADDPRAAALELAAALAAASPDAIAEGKRLIDVAVARDPATHLADEGETMRALAGSANQREAVMAFFEKRPASYTDRTAQG